MKRHIVPPPSFTERVYSIAANIPKGKVATYGQLARMAGSPHAARAVGMCMKHNPNKKIVPCHRVVGSTGELTGYTFGRGVSTKRTILEKEGVRFVGKGVDLNCSKWKPRKAHF